MDDTTVGDYRKAYLKAKKEKKPYFTICGIEFKTKYVPFTLALMKDLGIKDEENLMQVIGRFSYGD